MTIENLRETWLPAPEDVIVQKLRWGRSKDLDDARDVLAVQGPETLDMAYIKHWCAVHSTLDRLADALAGIPPRELLQMVLHVSWFLPFHFPTVLRSTGITPLHHYYGGSQPSPVARRLAVVVNRTLVHFRLGPQVRLGLLPTPSHDDAVASVCSPVARLGMTQIFTG